MKVTIFKYLILSSSLNQNYFSGNLTFQDKIILEKQSIDAFPIFKEEWNQEDNFQTLKTGYFDMNFALSTPERSEQNKNLFEFFNSVEDVFFYKERYLVVVQTGNSDRVYSGFIETDSIKANLSIGKNSITFAVTGIDKEAQDWIKRINLQRYGDANDLPFETEYLPHWHFKDLGGLLHLESRLNINSRVGYTILFDGGIQRELFDGGLNQGYSVWEGMKSFLVGLGIRFKIMLSYMDDHAPRFKIVLYFRSDGLNQSGHINKFLEYERSYFSTDAQYIFVPFAQAIDNNGAYDVYHGIIFSKDFFAITDFYFSENALLYQVNPGFYTYLIAGAGFFYAPGNLVTRLELGLHSRVTMFMGYRWTCAYSRCLYEAELDGRRFDEIIRKCTLREYQHLLQGLKLKKNIRIKVEDESNIVAGSKAVIQSKEYICERINSFNNFEKSMETEWIQS